MDEDKRKWPRVPYAVHALMDVNGDNHPVQCHNISMNGMKVTGSQLLPVGTEGQITIMQDMEKDRLLVHAHFHVMRHHTDSEGRCMGIHLKDIDADSSINLYHIVRHNTPDEAGAE